MIGMVVLYIESVIRSAAPDRIKIRNAPADVHVGLHPSRGAGGNGSEIFGSDA